MKPNEPFARCYEECETLPPPPEETEALSEFEEEVRNSSDWHASLNYVGKNFPKEKEPNQ